MASDLILDDRTRAWQTRAREFARERIRPGALEREWIQDPNERMPWDIIEAGSRAGFRTMGVPPRYGGPDPELSPLAAALVIEEFAAADPGVASSFNHVVKEIRQIARAGTEEQKEAFFAEFLADDRYLTGTAMTEPGHGSDRWLQPDGFHFDTTAVRDGEDWVINGRKHCITSGNEAGLLLVQATTDTSKEYPEATTVFMVRRNTPGLRRGVVHDKLGLRLVNNTEVIFDNCRVPHSQVLGEVNKGISNVSGFMHDNDLLSLGMKLGIARAAYETALDHAKNRVQGNTPIIAHQAVGLKLAEMAAHVEMIRSQMYRLAAMLEGREVFDPMFMELATWQSVESVFHVATLGVHVCGCRGVWLDHPAQKHLRDALVYFPNDGNHTTHLLVAHRMMMNDCR